MMLPVFMNRSLRRIVIEPNSENAFPKALAMGEPTMDFFSKKRKLTIAPSCLSCCKGNFN